MIVSWPLWLPTSQVSFFIAYDTIVKPVFVMWGCLAVFIKLYVCLIVYLICLHQSWGLVIAVCPSEVHLCMQ